MTASVVDVIAAVQGRVPYLRCATDAPAADGWITCADLIDDPNRLRAEIDATAPGRGTDDPQVAASLYAQSYAFRAPSIAVAAYALDLPVPSSAPATTAIRITRDRPGEVAITDPRCHTTDAAGLVRELFDEHLAPFIATVRSTTRVGERLLWGNVAASIATLFRAVQSCGPLGDATVRARAGEFTSAAKPWLDGHGDYSTIEVPGALGWYWTRTSCCLWYQTASGYYCDDCSLHDRAVLDGKRRGELTGSSPE
jgi:ferric iron reductase protein FhuF